MTQKFKWIVRVFAVATLLLMLSSAATASIVVVGTPVNTTDTFSATVTWTPGDDIEVIGVFGSTGTPWLVTLVASDNLFLAVAQHQVGPHAEDVNPNLNVVALLFVGAPGGTGTEGGDQPHPIIFGGSHQDSGVMTISPSTVSAITTVQSSTVNLVFTHAGDVAPVPEPATLALGMSGLGLFAFVRRSSRLR